MYDRPYETVSWEVISTNKACFNITLLTRTVTLTSLYDMWREINYDRVEHN